MDSLTHLLVGHAMGVAASSVAGPFGVAAYWGVLIGNSLPDIDVPFSLLVRRDIKLHRTVTHTIPGATALTAVAALLMQGFLPDAPLGILFFWTLLGSLAHMALDCLNLFGARPFWPLSGRSVDLGVLHILDPFILLLVGLPALGSAAGRASYSALILGFVLIWPYILYRLATAYRLYHRLKADGPLKVRIIPWFTSWRYIAETPTAIEFGRWAGGKRRPMQTYVKEDSPLIRATLALPQVSAFLASAEYPYALVQEDERGQFVIWRDALRQLRADFRPVQVRIDAKPA